MKILVIDNYDSFVYNLVYVIRRLGCAETLRVVRNDQIDLSEVQEYDKILLSPGPGVPKDAGIMNQLIEQYGSAKSILGICLGHQAIAEVYGARLYNMDTVLHGISGQIAQHDDPLFDSIPDQFSIGHYHSWAVEAQSITTPLRITAQDTIGQVMGIAHEQYDVKGLQFHPESVLTEYGDTIIKNWLKVDVSGNSQSSIKLKTSI